MNPPGGGEVQGKVSAVAGGAGRFAGSKPQDAGGEDLADLSDALGGGHQIRVEGVVQGYATTDVSADYIPDGGENCRDLRAGHVYLSDDDRHRR
jgi:hypothetical protein